MEEDINVTPTQSFQSQSRQIEGVAVVGEAVRRVPPERAEILIEVSVTSATVAEALRDHAAKFQQLAAAVGPIGIQSSDLQTVSMNVYNLYSPGLPGLPSLSSYGAMQQIGAAGLNPFGGGAAGSQPGAYSTPAEVQFGSYQLRCLIRVVVRDLGRVGEVVQSAIRAGAIPVGPLSFRASDESVARRAALEAAGADARLKAEAWARSVGKHRRCHHGNGKRIAFQRRLRRTPFNHAGRIWIRSRPRRDRRTGVLRPRIGQFPASIA